MSRNIIFILFMCIAIASCKVIPARPVPIATQAALPSAPITTDTADSFDLEKPLRCNVDWVDREVIMTVPYKDTVFKLERIDKTDFLPRYEVTGFSFEDLPAEKVLSKLLSEAEIKVVALDGPYDRLSAYKLKGELQETVDMICESAGIYYDYNEETKQIILSRKISWRLHMPSSKIVILAILDALRGAGIKDIITDWEDKVLMFEGGFDIEDKVKELTKYFDEEPNLIAYDVDIYRIYPINKQKKVVWQDILYEFPENTVKVSLKGMLGRLLITSPNLNSATLRKFLRTRAVMKQVSQGKFIIPNRWQSRFYIGRCGKQEMIESELSILVRAKKEGRHLHSDITFDIPRGEITNFSTKSRLGENLLIIGIPIEAFGVTKPGSEIVAVLSPRIVKVIESTDVTKPVEKSLF